MKLCDHHNNYVKRWSPFVSPSISGVATGGRGAARPECHSLGGDTQSMHQYLRNYIIGTQLSLLDFDI